MKRNNHSLLLATAGLLCALAVVGSLFSFPIFGSKCSPVQHMVNVVGAVLLGPWYNLGIAFLAALLRNILGLGSVLAFPGSMCGALLCGLIYRATRRILPALVGEIFGTGILGGLMAYPLAVAFLSVSAGSVAFYAYIIPFLVSTVVGSLCAGMVVYSLQRTGALDQLQGQLN